MINLKKKVLHVATDYTWVFVIVMTITLISCGFSIHYLFTLKANLQDVYENDVRGGDAVRSAYVALLGIESAAKDLVLYSEPEARNRTRAQIHDQVGTLKAALNRAYPRFYTPKARQMMATTLGDLKGFLGVLDDTLGKATGAVAITGTELGALEARQEGLEKDFTLLLANRAANSQIGITQLMSGEKALAEQAVAQALAIDPDLPQAWYTRSDMKVFTPDDADIGKMEALLAAADVRGFGRQGRLRLLFALGKAWMEAGDADRAFAHLHAGNQLKRASFAYAVEDDVARHAAIARCFTPDMLSRMAGLGDPSDLPVFIVGTVAEVIAVGGMGVADWPLVWGLLFGTLGIMHAGLIVGLGAMSARPENRAVGLGIFYTTYYVGGTVTPMVCGAAAQWMGDASGAFLCAAVLTASACRNRSST